MLSPLSFVLSRLSTRRAGDSGESTSAAVSSPALTLEGEKQRERSSLISLISLMPGRITRLLLAARSGDQEAFDALLPLVYDELRGLARNRMRAERAEHTLSPTALVHEAYLKLLGYEDVAWQNRAHFFAVAARAMRQILVDHARRRTRQKRGGNRVRVTLEPRMRTFDPAPREIVDLDQALSRLEEEHERRARVVVCRFFGGMQVDETAEALGVSAATVKRDWAAARVWLNRELGNGS